MESDLGISGSESSLCQWKLGINFLEPGESVICDVDSIQIGAAAASSSGWCWKSKEIFYFGWDISCGALQLKAQKIMFLSLCLRLGKVAAVVAPFLCSACVFGKGDGASFSKPVDDVYKGNMYWGIKQILVGQGRCFPLHGFHFPLGSGQVVTESWHLGGHSWLRVPDPEHRQKYLCWTLWMPRKSPQALDLRLSSPSLP